MKADKSTLKMVSGIELSSLETKINIEMIINSEY